MSARNNLIGLVIAQSIDHSHYGKYSLTTDLLFILIGFSFDFVNEQQLNLFGQTGGQ